MSHDPQANQFNDELLSAYIDGELSDEERALVEQRLADDPQARELVDELRALSDDLQALPKAQLGEDLRDVVLRQSEKAMLLGPDTEKTLPPASGGGSPRWLWAAVALAACLLLMFVMPQAQEDEPSLAVAKPEARDLVEQPVEREMRLEAPAPEAVAPEPAPAAAAIAAPAQPTARSASAGRSPSAPVSEPLAATSTRELRAATLPTEEQEEQSQQIVKPDLQVVITFNNGEQGLEQFDQLLLSNSIEFEGEQSRAQRARTNALAGRASSGRQLQQLQRGNQTIPAELVLVEARAAQVENILVGCSNETTTVDAVEVSSEKEASLPVPPEQFNRYSRAVGQPNQLSEQLFLGSKLEADLADEVTEGIDLADAAPEQNSQQSGRAMRLDASQWSAGDGDKLNLRVQNQFAANKFAMAKTEATSPLQVLFILQCPTHPQSSTPPAAAGARPEGSANGP